MAAGVGAGDDEADGDAPFVFRFFESAGTGAVLRGAVDGASGVNFAGS